MLFEIFLCIISALCLLSGIKLYAAQAELAGAALLPTLCGAVMLVCSVINLIRAQRVKPTALPVSVYVTLAFIAVFCVCLYFEVSLYIVSPLFLWGLMSYLRRGKLIQNTLIAALSAAIMYIVFAVLLGIY